MRTSKTILVAALAMGLATLFACDRKDDGDYRTSRARTTSGLTWLITFGESNLTEIEAGRLAETRAATTDVKQFGQHMVDDHSKIATELTSLAVKKQITVPIRAGEVQQKAVAGLAELSGADFDKKFADTMVSDHEKAVSLFESNGNSTDAEVKAFADKTLPTLKHHLQMARDLKTKMSGAPKAD